MKAHTKALLLALSASLGLTGVPTASAPAVGTERVFPFVLPWDDASPGPTDCSAWQDQPAGRRGRVRVGADGHFYTGERRIRFLGVNLSFGGGLPGKEEADRVASRLAKFGVNAVRFHHLDTGTFPDGIRDGAATGTGQLHPEALDRLGYLIARLKARGIYANLNLLVGRPFNAGDGLPPEIESVDWKERHVVGFFDAAQQALQREYARQLLLHRNPHTGLTFAQDPAVAFVEINNENGLVHAWLGGQVDRLPAVFRADLRRQWNRWLLGQRATDGFLRGAWGREEEPPGDEQLTNGAFAEGRKAWEVERHEGAEATTEIVQRKETDETSPAAWVRLEMVRPGSAGWHVQLTQAGFPLVGGRAYTLAFRARAVPGRSIQVNVGQAHEPWQNLGLAETVNLTEGWQEVRRVFRASSGDERARVSFGGLGGAEAVCELASVSLRPGGVTGLAPGESVERQDLPGFTRATFAERTPEAQRDWLRFLRDLEERYWLGMLRFLREDLRVQALVTGTISGCTPPNLTAAMDWVDTHAYFQHPHFPNRPWDAEDWIVENRTMVNERGGTLPDLALKRVLGKPHAVTEYNHPAPNPRASEGFLLLAAYGALQDWDALYVYSYAHSRHQGWDGRRINGFFDIDQHPTKMATLPAAAALFVRGDVQPAKERIVAALGRETEIDLLRSAGAWSLVDGRHVGIPREAALVHQAALATEGIPLAEGSLRPEALRLADAQWTADTTQLDWDLRAPNRGVVTVNTPQSKAVIGFGAGRRFALGEVAIEPGPTLQGGWTAITLTAMDAPAKRWLLTATGTAENTGMVWKDSSKSSVGRDWGEAPSRIEGVPATFVWSQVKAEPTPQVWALDDHGQRATVVPVEITASDRIRFRIGPEWKTLWYEVTLP